MTELLAGNLLDHPLSVPDWELAEASPIRTYGRSMWRPGASATTGAPSPDDRIVHARAVQGVSGPLGPSAGRHPTRRRLSQVRQRPRMGRAGVGPAARASGRAARGGRPHGSWTARPSPMRCAGWTRRSTPRRWSRSSRTPSSTAAGRPGTSLARASSSTERRRRPGSGRRSPCSRRAATCVRDTGTRGPCGPRPRRGPLPDPLPGGRLPAAQRGAVVPVGGCRRRPGRTERDLLQRPRIDGHRAHGPLSRGRLPGAARRAGVLPRAGPAPDPARTGASRPASWATRSGARSRSTETRSSTTWCSAMRGVSLPARVDHPESGH